MGSNADDVLVAAVAAAVEPVRLAAGEKLFSSGDSSDAAYFVVIGRLLVMIDDGAGTETVVRKVGRGKIVGEIGLVEQSERTATIRADRDCTLARLPASRVYQARRRASWIPYGCHADGCSAIGSPAAPSS